MFETFFWPKTVTHNVKMWKHCRRPIVQFSAPPQKNPLQILSKDQNIKRSALFTWYSFILICHRFLSLSHLSWFQNISFGPRALVSDIFWSCHRNLPHHRRRGHHHHRRRQQLVHVTFVEVVIKGGSREDSLQVDMHSRKIPRPTSKWILEK